MEDAVIGTVAKFAAAFVKELAIAWFGTKDPEVRKIVLTRAFPKQGKTLYVGCEYQYAFSFEVEYGEVNDIVDSNDDGGHQVTVFSLGDTKKNPAVNADGKLAATVSGEFISIAHDDGNGTAKIEVRHWGEKWGTLWNTDVEKVVTAPVSLIESVQPPLEVMVSEPDPAIIKPGDPSTVTLTYGNRACREATVTLEYEGNRVVKTLGAAELGNREFYTKRSNAKQRCGTREPLRWSGGTYTLVLDKSKLGAKAEKDYTKVRSRSDNRQALSIAPACKPPARPPANAKPANGDPRPPKKPEPTRPRKPMYFLGGFPVSLPVARSVAIRLEDEQGPIDGTAAGATIALSDAFGNTASFAVGADGRATGTATLAGRARLQLLVEDAGLVPIDYLARTETLADMTLPVQNRRLPRIVGTVTDTTGRAVHASLFAENPVTGERVFLTRTFGANAAYDLEGLTFRQFVPTGAALRLVARPRQRIDLEFDPNAELVFEVPDVTALGDDVRLPPFVFERLAEEAGDAVSIETQLLYRDRMSGALSPVEGLEIEVYAAETESLLGRASTDADGLVRFEVPKSQPVYAMATNHARFYLHEGHRDPIALRRSVSRRRVVPTVDTDLATFLQPGVTVLEGFKTFDSDLLVVHRNGEEVARQAVEPSYGFALELPAPLAAGDVVEVFERHGERFLVSSRPRVVEAVELVAEPVRLPGVEPTIEPGATPRPEPTIEPIIEPAPRLEPTIEATGRLGRLSGIDVTTRADAANLRLSPTLRTTDGEPDES